MHSNADAQRSPLSLEQCSRGRLTIDAFGYQKCVPSGPKEGGVSEETPPPVPPSFTVRRLGWKPRLDHCTTADDGRSKDDESCRQYAKESLSSTYGVYSQCMRERGWALKP